MSGMSNDLEAFFGLAGEALATQTVLSRLCQHLAGIDAIHRLAVTAALDSAADDIEHLAINLGQETRPEQVIRAGRIIEEIRAAIPGDQE